MASLRARLVQVFAFSGIAALVACGGEERAASDPEGDAALAIPRHRTAPSERVENAPPQIVSVSFEPERPTADGSVRAVVETEDPDGDSVWLQHVWRVDGAVVPGVDAARLLLRDAPKGASIEVEIVASDGVDTSEPWIAQSEVYNAIPELGVVRVEPEVVVAGDQPIVVRPEASDGDGDPITFEYTWTVNGRDVREKSATLSTRNLRRGDRVVVTVQASDGEDTSAARELPALRVANAAPRILSTPGGPAAAGGPFYQIHAEDPDGDPVLHYALEDAPEGMSVDARTGAIDWEPAPDQVGTHTVAIVVDDLQGGRSRQTIQVTVGEVTAATAPAARRR